MRRFIVGLLATVGALTLLAIGGIAAYIASGPFAAKPLAKPIVLSIDLRKVPPEATSTGLLRGGLFGGSRDIVDTVQLLWQAADDPRVVGLFVDIGDESAGLARVQELREAIARFRGKGKFAIGFAEFAGQRRHALRRLLPRLGAGADLAAAERRLRRGRHRRRDAVPKDRARQARRAGRGRQTLRIQERARHASWTPAIPAPPARTCSSCSTASMASS